MAQQIQLRRGTAAEWVAANPTLASGELGLETDTNRLKIGNGSTDWNGLSYESVTGVGTSAADILSISNGDIVADDAGADRIVFWDDSESKLRYLEAGANLSISGATLTAFGTINGGTGSTDNAILRADGTGGSTSQGSDINIDDATTSTQANVAITNQHSGQTNSALVLTPKGTGAFIIGPKPDGTSTGGNARGANAIELQVVRSAAIHVASGTRSICIGNSNVSSGTESITIGTSNNNTSSGGVALGGNHSVSTGFSACLGGQSNQASGSDWSCVVGGLQNIASNNLAFVGGGNENTASGERSVVVGGFNNLSSSDSALSFGQRAVANRFAMIAHSAGRFAANGDAQRIHAVLRNKTTTNSAVELFINGSSVRLTVPSGKVMAMLINITGVKSDGSAVAHYVRQYAIKNVGGTTSEVYAAATVGTDNAASTSIALSANDTNDALKIEVTGIASETWRWVASVDAVEVNYGT